MASPSLSQSNHKNKTSAFLEYYNKFFSRPTLVGSTYFVTGASDKSL